MDNLTFFRTFVDSSFTPVKGGRIYKGKWYLVAMQNVVHHPMTDYIGLGDGEYVELVPGYEAKRRRDAKLNHCNKIVEYTGSVYSLVTYPYNRETGSPATYYFSKDSLNAAIKAFDAERDKWIADMEVSRDKHLGMDADKVVNQACKIGIGMACIDDPEWIKEKVQWHRNVGEEISAKIEMNRNVSWRYETALVRP